jgi:transcriptional repressor OPI1
MLTEAGGLSAAFSDESMRRLKYCLQMLQFATQHIDNQIIILRDCIAGLQARAAGEPSASELRMLTNVRRDVIHTVRQVVEVVSKYAGGALPEPARARVKSFILHLPQRWAAANAQDVGGSTTATGVSTSSATQKPLSSRRRRHRERGSDGVGGGGGVGGTGNGYTSGTSSPAISRSSSPRLGPYAHPAPPPTAGSAAQAAVRILTLATESLDMMRGVTGVVKESLDRADAWVERLRVVGLQRSSSSMVTEDEEEDDTSFARNTDVEGIRMPKEEFDADALSPTPLSMSVEGVTPVSSVPSTPVVVLTPLDAHVRELSLKGSDDVQQADDDDDDAKTYAPTAHHGRMDIDS